MARSDLTLGISIVVLAAMLWFYLIPVGVTVPGGIKNFYQAPDFWIRMITIGLMLTGGLHITKGYSARSTPDGAIHPLMPRALKLGTGILVFFLFYALLDWLGMILCSNLAIIAIALIYGERRLQYLAPIAILLPVGLYFFFLKVASIPMPVGILSGIGPF